LFKARMIDNKYVPSEDGITHINIYSKGKTEIGRFASNFAFSPFECEDGKFDSIEGYWYWLTINPSNPRRDELRKLYGFEAKRIGRELRGKDWNLDEEFKKKICNAIKIKFEEYLNWAKNGWNDSFAHRYPIGKGIKPKFSVKLKLDDQNRVIVDKQLSYIEARKELYIPGI